MPRTSQHLVDSARKRLPVLAPILAAILWILVGATPAAAGTVVGSDLAKAPGKYFATTVSYYDYEDEYYDWYTGGCSECTYINGVSPGAQSAVTQPGIVTRGSIRTNGALSVNIRIARPQGGLVYQFIGESGFQNVGAGVSTLALPNVVVQPGDTVAVSGKKTSANDIASFLAGAEGAYAYYTWGEPAIPVGVSATFTGENRTELLASIYVEGDADADGQPDESGDADTDNDGEPNAAEALLGTNPSKKDTDNDGIQDGDEDRNHDGRIDADPKKYRNRSTCARGKKRKRFKRFKAAYLARIETDPRKTDTDGDKVGDGIEAGAIGPVAPSASILGTEGTFRADANPKTVSNPRQKDTDGDRKKDGKEDRNRDGNVKKKRESDPNKPTCRKRR